MSRKRLNTIRNIAEGLQEKIELLEKQFGSVHPIYKEMGGLVRSLRIKIIDLEEKRTDYRGNILVKEDDWEKLKKVGYEIDEILGNHIHSDEYIKYSKQLWRVINKSEGLK